MGRKMSAAEEVDKQIKRMRDSEDELIKGVEAMSETPGKAAIREKDKYKRNVLRALEDGSFEAGNLSYDLPSFITTTVKKAKDRWVAGAEEARDRTILAREPLIAHRESIQRELANMPKRSDADMDARMLHNKRRMAEYKKPRVRR